MKALLNFVSNGISKMKGEILSAEEIAKVDVQTLVEHGCLEPVKLDETPKEPPKKSKAKTAEA